jgi:hypothetical protein
MPAANRTANSAALPFSSAVRSAVTIAVEEGVDMLNDRHYQCAFAPTPLRVKCNTSGIAAAVKLATSPTIDVIVLALGNSEWNNGFTAHENKDRLTIGLPGQQQELVDAVMSATSANGTPVVAVLINGGLASVDSLAASNKRLAIVEALLPGNTGATAVAQALYGANTWGKLPFTMYPSDFVTESAFDDLSMTTPPVHA